MEKLLKGEKRPCAYTIDAGDETVTCAFYARHPTLGAGERYHVTVVADMSAMSHEHRLYAIARQFKIDWTSRFAATRKVDGRKVAAHDPVAFYDAFRHANAAMICAAPPMTQLQKLQNILDEMDVDEAKLAFAILADRVG